MTKEQKQVEEEFWKQRETRDLFGTKGRVWRSLICLFYQYHKFCTESEPQISNLFQNRPIAIPYQLGEVLQDIIEHLTVGARGGSMVISSVASQSFESSAGSLCQNKLKEAGTITWALTLKTFK